MRKCCLWIKKFVRGFMYVCVCVYSYSTCDIQFCPTKRICEICGAGQSLQNYAIRLLHGIGSIDGICCLAAACPAETSLSPQEQQ